MHAVSLNRFASQAAINAMIVRLNKRNDRGAIMSVIQTQQCIFHS